jgi:hypothetical protein
MPIFVTAKNASADPMLFTISAIGPRKRSSIQLVSKHYPVFKQQLAREGRALPDYAQREFVSKAAPY